ncbi:peptidase S41 [Salegentibacter salinarum]|uniref:Tricorn protease homolog n=1 Tax=Salegentibacter salinarum TaxID=447422 RepID=A0A2N0TMC8_9FLAO|nr:S41 family peptidase [Salegentibacter salinarum]PKD15895.1 peptidase S41 [Salegentibacter salinarum]SKB71951.1 tricorn protease [Salegentibacter salinarum]
MIYKAPSLLIFLLVSFTLSAQDINKKDTRLLSKPAISDSQIAFIYAEDLWVANKDGSFPKRLTVDDGIESNPVFSPDGSLIAFNAEYDGNTDVYVVSADGGVPERLSWHPGSDQVRGFTPDGSAVLFASQRSVFTNRYMELFEVSVSGGQVKQLDIPNAFWADYSDDGRYIAYTPLYEVFNQWKYYRGGTASRIWIYDTNDHSVTEIPKPESGSNDTRPQWLGDKIYFRSDRNGEFNLYSYDMNSAEVAQHTNYEDFPVLDLSAGDNEIIFEQAGYLHTFNPTNNNASRLQIGIATDLLELRPRFVKGDEYIRSASISPTGARVVMDFRGEIVTLPGDKGDVVNVTATPGIHEQDPVWSPNGKFIAYFSDESGEYALHVHDQSDEKQPQKFELDGTGFYAYPKWSPDSKKISFVDNGRNLYVLNTDSGRVTKVAQDKRYMPGVFRDLFGSWSHDSSWISYTVVTETSFEQAYVYSLSENESYPISDGFSSVSSPVFDPSGKYLYMLASTDAGPVVNWFDQSNQDMEMTSSIYLVTLQKDVESPFARENDVEKIEQAEKEEEKKKKAEEEDKEIKAPDLKIDFSGIESRIVDVPVPAGKYASLSSPKEGNLYYLSFPPHEQDKGTLNMYDLKERENKEIMPATAYEISANAKMILYKAEDKWGIAEIEKIEEKHPLNTEDIQVKIDPIAEWPNIFNEAWRVNRDYFYDPGMHGVDWDEMKEKYKPFIGDVTSRGDLYRVMEWMFSELGVGHHRFSSRGDRLHSKESVKGGLLGADYSIENNRYRFKKIYGGLNWNPNLRSPLTEPGVDVQEGDYILEVNGKELKAEDNIYKFFENTAGKIVMLTVGPNSNMKNSRKVKVTPIENEGALRNRDWVEGNIEKVHEATDGKVAYVYVPNTATAGHEYFKRYFFPQANKQAIIVDERFNGGGQLADYVIDILKKPEQAHWRFRYGKDLKSPSASIQGPKVMITDETAGSGGDYLPWMFRKFDLGTIVGKTTWGGLVGVLGYPEFLDGGSVTAPNVAFYTEEGFKVENEGVAPDVEVEQWPEEVIEGKDPQLEKAIEIVLKQLEENPPGEVASPVYPKKGN